ncbi:hypothetical protein SAMN05444285_15814 [Draconibacterium orientale]|jgi:hypothetical protein|uniref:Uncharacterized protein n=1 Tax=Draconibacterium orientale TaxID=1168034 RepID=X5DYH3_9BACT|nr:DUF5320 domain-containing protein [Draconibacterium orientale]AHW59341.1 hypothetical protein FH5T_06275 [Draconibacterium orientale]SEU15117.1 hypothetical protein SAMN05444285_15814 [Draconibacterium orientale]
MPKLNGTGPEGKGPKTGRGLGECEKKSFKELFQKLGKGLGKRRKSGGGEGRGKRLKYDQKSG